MRFFSNSKVRGPRHRNVRYLPQADIRTIICGLFMFDRINSFRSFISAMAFIIRGCISSILRIRASLVNTSHFGSAFRRYSMSRAFRRPMVNSNVLSLIIKRSNRLRTISKVAASVTSGNPFVLLCVSPSRHPMATFYHLIRRLITRVHLNVQDLNCRRRTKNILISTIRRSRVQIVNVVVKVVLRVPNCNISGHAIVITVAKIRRRANEFIRCRRVLILVCCVGKSIFKSSFVLVT